MCNLYLLYTLAIILIIQANLIIPVEASKDLVGYFVSHLIGSKTDYENDGNTLTRIMVSRCEVDMQQIKACFKAKYAVDLYSVIEVKLDDLRWEPEL